MEKRMEKTDYKITEFHNSEFGSIRMIEDGGRLLFSGIDVAFALGYAKPRNAINVHCKGALKRGVLTSGGVQPMIFIPEGDVYRLITKSRLKSAQNFEVSFHDKLFELIDEAHLDNKDVWKRANLDRKHFSKIQCDQNYHPKKKTVMALCIALQLDLEQSRDLLARADWAFSPSSKVDLIVQKAIIDKQYDIMQLNVILFKYTNEILGV